MIVKWRLQQTAISIVIHYLAVVYVLARVMLRPYREPASRVAWMAVIGGIPIFGMVFYFMFGETNIGFKRAERMREIAQSTFVKTGNIGGT